jgi:hypothetical protein
MLHIEIHTDSVADVGGGRGTKRHKQKQRDTTSSVADVTRRGVFVSLVTTSWFWQTEQQTGAVHAKASGACTVHC